MALRGPQKNLKRWGEQKWRTKSGKPSAETGERYLPERAIKMLSSAKYAAGTRRKRKGTAKGEQRVPYTKSEKSAFLSVTGKKYKARKKK